jgi:hypothetical protein
MKSYKNKAFNSSVIKQVFVMLSTLTLLLSTNIAQAAIGYKHGFDKAILLGHSFFKPGTDDLEVLAPFLGYDRHNQYLQTAGGTNGDPGSLWRDIDELEPDNAKAEIKMGGVELLALTVYDPADGDSDYEDYVTWIDFTLQYNAGSLDTVAIFVPWNSYQQYPNYEDYRAITDDSTVFMNDLIQDLRVAYPQLTILHIPGGEIMTRLWKLHDDGLLGPEVKGIYFPNDRNYLQRDNIGHPGYVVEDAIGLVWQQTIYPETDIRTLNNPPTYQKDWTYDLRQLAYEVWSDESYAHRYNDGPITPTPPEFNASPIIESATIVELAYNGSTLADNALDDNSDELSFARVSGPSWLKVAADGALSGAPESSNLGLNSFVVSVSDGEFAAVEETLQVTVIDADVESKILEDASFENVGTPSTNGNWAEISASWNDSGSGTNEVARKAFSSESDGDWAVRLKTVGPIYQDLNVSVSEGETLEVSFYAGRAKDTLVVAGGGVLESAFIVGSTRYSLSVDTTALPQDSWQQYTHNVTVSDSGPASIEFIRLSGEPFIDAVSEVKIVAAPDNAAPVFASSSITRSDALADQEYNDTIAGSATDADGDTLTYSKVSGDTWLLVAENGALSGKPNEGFIGTSTAIVKVSDGEAGGGSDTATLSIIVNEAPVSSALIDDGFESFNSTGWVTDWEESTAEHYTGETSLKGSSTTNNLESPEMDISSKSSITLSFKYYIQDIDPNDNVVLMIWNGNSYINVAEIGDDADRTWLEYNRTVTKAQYPMFFKSGFKFKIEASNLSSGGAIWVDDMLLIAE